MKPVGRDVGHFLGAMRISAFTDPDEFKARVDEWIRTRGNTVGGGATPSCRSRMATCPR
jgi:hypothetical protein